MMSESFWGILYTLPLVEETQAICASYKWGGDLMGERSLLKL